MMFNVRGKKDGKIIKDLNDTKQEIQVLTPSQESRNQKAPKGQQNISVFTLILDK